MAETILFAGGNLLDPRQSDLIEGVDVLVEDGRVKEVSETPIKSDSAVRIDIAGKTICPGLIDAHVHMFMNEMNLGLARTVPVTYASAKAAFVLKGMLMRGFTTVRDMAGGDFGMRDASASGYIDTPRLFISGRSITQTGGHGDFREASVTTEDYACCSASELFSIIADGLPEVLKAVRDELRKGADQIKVMLSGGVASPNDPLNSLQYRSDELEAIVEEATRWGVYVAGHAYSDDAIKRGLAAGIRTIEHGNFITPETAKTMSDLDAYLVPTLITYDVTKKLGPASGKSEVSLRKNDEVHAAGLQSLEICRAAGVPIGYGTDLSFHTQQWQCSGLALQAEVQSAGGAIEAATIVNARILRHEGLLGELVPGAHADLLVIDGNPLADLSVFDDQGSKLDVIMKGGKFFKNTLTT
ncbi:amidohydrolase family protein [Marivita sp. S6314]|uniref:metal-dependent hydrolase family protein n=1 Tax=Marivita sp. S6314 TaxID=2926406 RepID=UPI001FF46C36|nr:amidohydrolase family protein [Marivita sp. S6314]MCK0150837.1 amidohydrolase family protein [Marivita sp. S6314]